MRAPKRKRLQVESEEKEGRRNVWEEERDWETRQKERNRTENRERKRAKGMIEEEGRNWVKRKKGIQDKTRKRR
jgi:hypothetical protein